MGIQNYNGIKLNYYYYDNITYKEWILSYSQYIGDNQLFNKMISLELIYIYNNFN
jgi:hypothetical protein